MPDINSIKQIQFEAKKFFEEEYRKSFNKDFSFEKSNQLKEQQKQVVINVYGVNSKWL